MPEKMLVIVTKIKVVRRWLPWQKRKAKFDLLLHGRLPLALTVKEDEELGRAIIRVFNKPAIIRYKLRG